MDAHLAGAVEPEVVESFEMPLVIDVGSKHRRTGVAAHAVCAQADAVERPERLLGTDRVDMREDQVQERALGCCAVHVAATVCAVSDIVQAMYVGGPPFATADAKFFG
jgi:hypothetical protein